MLDDRDWRNGRRCGRSTRDVKRQYAGVSPTLQSQVASLVTTYQPSRREGLCRRYPLSIYSSRANHQECGRIRQFRSIARGAERRKASAPFPSTSMLRGNDPCPRCKTELGSAPCPPAAVPNHSRALAQHARAPARDVRYGNALHGGWGANRHRLSPMQQAQRDVAAKKSRAVAVPEPAPKSGQPACPRRIRPGAALVAACVPDGAAAATRPLTVGLTTLWRVRGACYCQGQP